MTTVSKPNSSPASAATSDQKKICLIFYLILVINSIVLCLQDSYLNKKEKLEELLKFIPSYFN